MWRNDNLERVSVELLEIGPLIHNSLISRVGSIMSDNIVLYTYIMIKQHIDFFEHYKNIQTNSDT